MLGQRGDFKLPQAENQRRLPSRVAYLDEGGDALVQQRVSQHPAPLRGLVPSHGVHLGAAEAAERRMRPSRRQVGLRRPPLIWFFAAYQSVLYLLAWMPGWDAHSGKSFPPRSTVWTKL